MIIKAVEAEEFPAHLLPGSVAVNFAANVFASRTDEVQKWKELSVQTDAEK